jgi:hypothetical protein
MRNVRVSLCLGLLALVGGCNSVPWARTGAQPQGMRVASATPRQAELVAALNDNARRVQALECRDVDMDCTQRLQSVGLRAVMFCQKPHNFRMRANLMGSTAVDMGSNDREFWYWISKADPPYLFHCTYDDYAGGRARTPFPFQPDWLLEALGIAEYDPAKPYEIVPGKGGSIDLVEKAVSPQGQPVRKVTRLSPTYNQWQVTAHLLENAAGTETVCAAYVTETQQDRTTGALLPRRVELVWPAEHIKMKLRLDQVTVNPPTLTPDRVTVLFGRPAMKDVPSYDLARGLDPAANSLRPAGYR